mgnify:CR=1 FL=1
MGVNTKFTSCHIVNFVFIPTQKIQNLKYDIILKSLYIKILDIDKLGSIMKQIPFDRIKKSDWILVYL